ncbi:MAG TPA: UvrD-helicase domain-containing protein [Polyangiaceae bacterium]|nr:UvrD-helicase domain-containing protein [Polyangiaceae bacterium]
MIPGLAHNAVVAASAGTGKTELLTSIYLAHCLGLHAGSELVSPTRIVATTFSRAAAREIRERLERRFAGVLGEDVAEYEQRLGAELMAVAHARGLSRPELQRRAARALDDLPDASIDTLHNLCARILREHGLELGISPAFSILEEQRSLEETEAAIDEVLSDALAGSDDQALGAQQLLDAAGGLDRVRGWLVALFSRLDDEGLDAVELELPDEASAARRVEAQLNEVCSALLPEDSARSVHARAVVEALLRRPAGLDAQRLSEAFAALAGEKKGPRTEAAAALRELLESAGSGTNPEKARALVRFIVEGPELGARLRAVAAVIGAIQRRLRERHVAERSLGFGDLLRLTRDGLREHPEVARAAGSRITLLLVDEFQDTSRVQCELLLLLRERPERSRARAPGTLPQAADILPQGLVVVGDRKQSIYGFRGADVSVFSELATSLAGSAAAELLDLPPAAAASGASAAMAEVSTLVDSYRSDRAIVSAVNIVSERDFAPRLGQSFEIRYARAEALRVPAARGAVADGSFTLLVDDDRTPEAEPFVMKATGTMRSALAVAGYCARAVHQGRPLKSLAVLARKRATLPLLGFALDHFGVPYVVAGRDLYGTPEVRDVFAALRLSQAPRERHALATLSRSPLGGLSDQALVELSDPRRGLLPHTDWDLARLSRPEDVQLVTQLKRRLEAFLRIAPRLSPRDAIHDVVERFELPSVLSLLPRGAVRLANIGRLQEIAASHGGNLAAFVRFVTRQIAWELDETEAALFSPDDEAVRLLTIHGSKGLAFPTVILADTDATELLVPGPVGILRRPDARPVLVVKHAGEDGPIVTGTQTALAEDFKARAQAERQRLSYVALTRARHELVVALPSKPRSGTLAKTVLELHGEGAFGGVDGFAELQVSELLVESKLATPSSVAHIDPPLQQQPLDSGAVVLGVTALSDFQICPRRFSLLQLQGLSEPRRGGARHLAEPELDSRLAGIAAHAVLEHFPLERWGEPPDLAELGRALEQAGLPSGSSTGEKTLAGLSRFLGGSYASRVRREAVRVERELSLTVTLVPREMPRKSPQLELFGAPVGTPLVIRATLDLLVELSDGSLHVIDYKRTRGGGGDPARYGPQLALYRSVVREHFGKLARVGLLHLLGDATEPEWLDPTEIEPGAVARAFVEARSRDAWGAVPEAVCQAVHCGFISSCHPSGA